MHSNDELSQAEGTTDETKPDGAVRGVVRKGEAVAGHFIEQAGERVMQAGEYVGEAVLDMAVSVEKAGERLKAAGKKLSHSK